MKTVTNLKNGGRVAKPLRRTPSRTSAAAPVPGQPTADFHVQKILVPVDFSECSAKALDYARAFARPAQAEILLLHVVEPIVYPMYGQEITTDYSALQLNLRKAGQQHLAEFSKSNVGEAVPVKLLVSEGSAWCEIVEVARREGVDLIIVSTHGRTGLRHVLMGSTAERVVRHAPCPVLIVREREREFVTPSPADQPEFSTTP